MDMRSVTVVKEQDLSCNVGNANTNDNRDERRRVAASQLRCRSRGPGTPETNDARASCQQGPVGVRVVAAAAGLGSARELHWPRPR